MADTISTARLRLRPWSEKDRKAFACMNADPQVMEFFPKPLTQQESDLLAERIQAHIEQHGWGLWALEIPDVVTFAGFVGLAKPRFEAPFTPCVEIGWRLDSAYWGHGYASEAAAAVLAFGFGQLCLPEIVSFTACDNRRSMRVMERIGLERDPHGDFDHPSIAPGHPLQRHVLYRRRAPG